jgi:hypothetical protein
LWITFRPLPHLADFDNRDYLGTNYTSSGIATLEAIEAIERDLGTTETSKPYL